ncbi:hypothetical protein H072_7591 [Dactylellina haptotyla CBS 200.50]|uniref:F-box domain-containing protein n=1 Tax=Dactylellina haptotyla (strain CBS 200.50) TaxID=1284197 RepID=S8A6J0_DACHA|nr:hypothetical protein H072_7591 [Dactylellina haptotyla CBS 200.50]
MDYPECSPQTIDPDPESNIGPSNNTNFITSPQTGNFPKGNVVLAPEIIVQIFSHFDSYSVLHYRGVCRAFNHAALILYPNAGLDNTFPIAVWHRICSHFTRYTDVTRLLKVSKSFHSMLVESHHPVIKHLFFHDPLNADYSKAFTKNRAQLALTNPSSQSMPIRRDYLFHRAYAHPAFKALWIRSIYPGEINVLRSRMLPRMPLDPTNPVLKANATFPPVRRVIVQWAGGGCTNTDVDPVIAISKDENTAITVYDVFDAFFQLLHSPMTRDQLERYYYPPGFRPIYANESAVFTTPKHLSVIHKARTVELGRKWEFADHQGKMVEGVGWWYTQREAIENLPLRRNMILSLQFVSKSIAVFGATTIKLHDIY